MRNQNGINRKDPYTVSGMSCAEFLWRLRLYEFQRKYIQIPKGRNHSLVSMEACQGDRGRTRRFTRLVGKFTPIEPDILVGMKM